MAKLSSISNLNRRIAIVLRKLITNSYYRLLLHSLGEKSIIGRPLFLTPEFVSIGSYVYIWPNCRIEGISQYQNDNFNPLILINDKVTIQQNLHLTCAKEIVIGKATAIASNVTITDIDHGYIDIFTPPEEQKIVVTKVKIGENCKIYNNVVILPGVNLGRHTIVGANSVVKKGNYPDFCVMAGIPAKVIKRYDCETQTWRKTDEFGNFTD